MQVVVAREEVVAARKKMHQAVTCRQVLQKE